LGCELVTSDGATGEVSENVRGDNGPEEESETGMRLLQRGKTSKTGKRSAAKTNPESTEDPRPLAGENADTESLCANESGEA
jgi:hypothetical protein